jgi:hypothetical protein
VFTGSAAEYTAGPPALRGFFGDTCGSGGGADYPEPGSPGGRVRRVSRRSHPPGRRPPARRAPFFVSGLRKCYQQADGGDVRVTGRGCKMTPDGGAKDKPRPAPSRSSFRCRCARGSSTATRRSRRRG